MSDSAEPQSLLNPDTLRRLLRQLEQTDIDELEVSSGSSRLYLRREPGKRTIPPDGATTSRQAPEGLAIVAPLTGLFYAGPTPADPPYVEVGSSVTPGQVVALIETMKIFNEIKAEIGGEVTEILSHDGDLVEAGAPLMYVKAAQGEGE